LSKKRGKRSCFEQQYKFYSNEEATGMTLFPVDIQRNSGGYDVSFSFLGSEDTEVQSFKKVRI
jgi:hypothetical protein